jgi:DNA-binding NtrC family response regulator
MTLDRARFHLADTPGADPLKGKAVELPACDTQGLSFSLILCEAGQGKDSGRYLLRSNTHSSFRLNGNFAFEAFIARGDIVEMGLHRLEFQAGHIREKEGRSLPLSDRVISSMIPILLEGETGTGKTRLARLIHEQSGRAGAFIHLNIASFGTGVIESELFGHVKGSFTGAVRDNPGAFLSASGGTLFLDEIDSLPRDVQTKLLLFLDTKVIRAVGDTRTKMCDVRLVIASGRSLESLLREKTLREDFYFRITSGIRFQLPSLRDDHECIGRICHEFADTENIHIPDSLIEFYKTCPWPGNIRQLLSHLQKKMIFSSSKTLNLDSTDASLAGTSAQVLARETNFLSLKDLKTKYALQAFQHFRGSIPIAAKALSIAPNTLRALIRQ